MYGLPFVKPENFNRNKRARDRNTRCICAHHTHTYRTISNMLWCDVLHIEIEKCACSTKQQLFSPSLSRSRSLCFQYLFNFRVVVLILVVQAKHKQKQQRKKIKPKKLSKRKYFQESLEKNCFEKKRILTEKENEIERKANRKEKRRTFM